MIAAPISPSSTNPVMTKSYCVNPYVCIIPCSNDEVLVKHGSRSRFSRVIRDDGHSNLLSKIISRMRSPASLADLQTEGLLTEEQQENAEALVTYLLQEHVLISPDEHLPHVYLSMHFGGQASRIGTRTVGFVGTGALAMRIARELGRLQPKGLVLLDDRAVTSADRLFFDVTPNALPTGASYTQVVTDDLASYGYDAVTSVEGSTSDPVALTELFEQSDFVVVAMEWFSPRIFHAVNEVAIEMRKPWMSLYADGSEALIGPIYVPGETHCYSEFEIQREANISLRDEYLLYKETLLEEDLDTRHQCLPPYLSMMSGWASSAIVPFLLTGRSFAVGRCLYIDFERMSVDFQEVLKLPRCPACSPLRPGYRQTYL
jgi:thiazole/oxazole-forming peptide maturase SagC family component